MHFYRLKQQSKRGNWLYGALPIGTQRDSDPASNTRQQDSN